ncbi:MAG: SAM-dependent methyltransferase, partial [Alteromonadaceae bacterium]
HKTCFQIIFVNQFIPYRKNTTPWDERFFSAMRVKDWLHLMGYEILVDEKILHSSLSGKLNLGKVAKYWQEIASEFLPNLGSIYILVAKKRVHPLTPIKPKWKIRPKFNQVEVPSMNSSHKIK